MKFGALMFFTDYSMPPAGLAVALEERGFDIVWAPEHSHIPISRKTPFIMGGDLPKRYYDVMDPFVTLTAAAMATKTLRVGTGVCLIAQRDPIQTAKLVASIDVISGGRFVFGVGNGWNQDEMENHGTVFASRHKLAREKIEAMKAIWTQTKAEYHGEFVNFDPMMTWPKPVQKPYPPIFVGGAFPYSARRAVRYGDGWMPQVTEYAKTPLIELIPLVPPDGGGKRPRSGVTGDFHRRSKTGCRCDPSLPGRRRRSSVMQPGIGEGAGHSADPGPVGRHHSPGERLMDPSLHDELTGWRRHLHANPELTLHEKETSAFVQARLTELGVPFVAGVGGHGVVATLRRGSSNRSVGLRADMDALPIIETSGVTHASRNPALCTRAGMMAIRCRCSARRRCWRAIRRGPAPSNWCFNPAEEGGGGAKSMIADGLFERFPMERIFGYHNWPGLEAGTVAIYDGPVMASGGRIHFTIKGHSGHAALPHLARDPMIAAAHLLLALQTIVSRNVDPLDSAVITIGIIQAGSAANQIPGEAVMRGTMRTLRASVRDEMEAAVDRVAAGVAQTFGVKIDVEQIRGMGVTANTPAERDLASEAVQAAGIPLRRDLPPAMTGEDFSWYLEHRPGAFAWIGNGPADGGRELHNSNYDFNDAILPSASGYLAAVAKRALG